MALTVLGIDPGTVNTAFAVWDGQRVVESALMPNKVLLEHIRSNAFDPLPMFVEMIASYGMPVGKDVFETTLWIGRFIEVWDIKEFSWTLVYRLAIKNHHCHASNANDATIRRALIDRVGPPGTKKAPGPTYGVKKDMWSALAVAVYGHDLTLAKV